METEKTKLIAKEVETALEILTKRNLRQPLPVADEAATLGRIGSRLRAIRTILDSEHHDVCLPISKLLSLLKMLESLERTTSEHKGLPYGSGSVQLYELTDTTITLSYRFDGRPITKITIQ